VRLARKTSLLTAAPSHVSTLSLYGFSPMPERSARYLKELSARGSLENALPLLLKAGVAMVGVPRAGAAARFFVPGNGPLSLVENDSSLAAELEGNPGGPPGTAQPFCLPLGRERAGVLRTADFSYPGWRAFAEGRALETMARRVFRAAKVPLLTRQVRFLYRPPLFPWGWETLLALGLTAVFCIMKLSI